MDERFVRGAAAFNAGQFFEAHEVWEELWLETVGPEKRLLQGLVQIAAGYAKVESGIRSGAMKLLARGIQHLRDSAPIAAGFTLESFVAGVDADLQRLQQTAHTEVSLSLTKVPNLRPITAVS